MQKDTVTYSTHRELDYARKSPRLTLPRPPTPLVVDPLIPADFEVTSLTPRPSVDAESSISQVTMDAIVAASVTIAGDASETSLELHRRPTSDLQRADRSLTDVTAVESFVGRMVGDVHVESVFEITGGRLVLAGHVADGTPRQVVVLPAELSDDRAAAIEREVRELSTRARIPCPRPLGHGRVGGRLWVSYEHEDGRLLSEVIGRRRLSASQAVACALELVDAAIAALAIDTALGAPFAGREWPMGEDAVVLRSDGRIATQAMWAGTWAVEDRAAGELRLRGQLDRWLATIAAAAPPDALGPLAPLSSGPSTALSLLREQLARRLMQLRARRTPPGSTARSSAASRAVRGGRSDRVMMLSLAVVLLSATLTAAALLVRL